jgi:hypothetical protein
MKSRGSSGNSLETYVHKLENLEEMGKCIDANKQLKLNQEDINHPNRSITSNKI